MSFLDDIVSVGKTVFGGDSLGSSLARTAAIGGTLYLLSKSGKSSDLPSAAGSSAPDPRNRIQLDPSPDNRIPVVYGTTFVPGIITDAQISENNTVMHFVYTICEKTGVKLSDGTTSTIGFDNIYINDQRVVFKEDGITVDYTLDRESNVDYTLQDLVEVRCYAGSSDNPVTVAGYAYNALYLEPAYDVVPNWTSAYTMDDLVFAVIRVTYNKDRGVTSAPGAVKFHITNSMTMPGDCLYDYMTNTRYGAGIDPTEIYV